VNNTAALKTSVRAAEHLYPQMQQLPEVGCFTQWNHMI